MNQKSVDNERDYRVGVWGLVVFCLCFAAIGAFIGYCLVNWDQQQRAKTIPTVTAVAPETKVFLDGPASTPTNPARVFNVHRAEVGDKNNSSVATNGGKEVATLRVRLNPVSK